MPDVEVVHLVWKAAGLDPFRRFIESYRSHPAGVDHRLVVLYNGFAAADLKPYRDELAGIPHDELRVPRRSFDLYAYFWAAARRRAQHVCFVNSYSIILVDGWLAALYRHAIRPGVGAVGATGSWESAFSNYTRRLAELGRPRSPVGWALHLNRLRKLRRYRMNFDPAPNPHLRSNAFLVDRVRWLALRRPGLTSKWQTLLFESGKDGMARQLKDQGLEVLVAGRDGEAYPPERWPESRTFRQGNQENLLVGDNRTRQYDEAEEPMRRYMREIAWG